jgi:Fe-S cluster assembly protein SufD
MEVISINKAVEQKELFEKSLFASNFINPLHVEAAKNTLANLYIPTTRNEYWKYTRLMKLSNTNFSFQKVEKPENVKAFSINEECYKLNYINGFFDESTSQLPLNSSIQIGNSSILKKLQLPTLSVESDKHYFNALNQCMAQDGFVINIPFNTELDKPIFISNQTLGNYTASMQRNVVVVGKSSKAKIIISSQSAAACFINNLSEITLEENAFLEMYILQHGGSEHFQIESTYVKQAKDSHFKCVTISLQADLIRNNVNVELCDTNAETSLYGAYLAAEGTIDNHTFINHASPNCLSNEAYKGVLGGKANGVFNGKVMVMQNAQKTNAFQSNKNVLLSDNANMYSKPELEIYADDVKCSHGSTTGQLDDLALFYLRSRGIGEKEASKMLINAFLYDICSEISIESYKLQVEQLIDNQLQKL